MNKQIENLCCDIFEKDFTSIDTWRNTLSGKKDFLNKWFFGKWNITASGHSYKHFTLINYDSRVVPDWKIPHIMTLES